MESTISKYKKDGMPLPQYLVITSSSDQKEKKQIYKKVKRKEKKALIEQKK